jgi:hypothetical protein
MVIFIMQRLLIHCYYGFRLHNEAKKKICVFTVACQQNLGSVGSNFFFYYWQNRKVVPESDSCISYSKFPVSRHLF